MKIPRFKINIPKVSMPRISMPSFRLPAFKLPKFKWWTTFLNKTKTSFDFILPYAIGLGNGILYTLTFLTVISGTFILTITLINPENLIWSIAPLQTPVYIVTYSSLMGYLAYFQEYYWESVGISLGSILFGLSLIHI